MTSIATCKNHERKTIHGTYILVAYRRKEEEEREKRREGKEGGNRRKEREEEQVVTGVLLDLMYLDAHSLLQ